MASESPEEVRGSSGTPPALKDHRQKEGLCLPTVGGHLRASLLELADLVRKHFVQRRGLGFLQAFSPVPVLRGPATLGSQGVLVPSRLEKQLSWQLATCSRPPASPLFGLTHESPRLTLTSSGHGLSITAMPSRPVAGASSFLSAQLRKPGTGRQAAALGL